jgi:thioredoxin 1
MSRKKILLRTLILIIGGILALSFNFKAEKRSEEGISFIGGTFHEALEKANKEDKYVFLQIYATWCGPCKKLKQTTFVDPGVGEYFNQNFINISINGETAEGKEIIKKYNLRSYPSLLILDLKGEVMKTSYGYRSSKQLLSWAKN